MPLIPDHIHRELMMHDVKVELREIQWLSMLSRGTYEQADGPITFPVLHNPNHRGV